MKRILFVDDEQRLLDGLQGLLRRHRVKWDMVFACGARAALDQLAGAHFDVIVSDMRMPHMSGAALLGQVRERYPHMVRIMLSGFNELDSRMMAVPVAHQFLTKPCDGETLDGVIERAVDLQRILQSDQLRQLVGRIDRLPPTPRIYAQLLRVSESADASVGDLARVLAQDVSMSAKILQLVNSAFFGFSRRLSTIENAVSMLGFETLKSLVLSLEVFGADQTRRYQPGFDVEALQRHALTTASLTRVIAPRASYADDAFMAAMLHDIGELILATQPPGFDAGAVSHAEVGAYLLGLWGFPYSIVEAVAHHHRPSRVPARGFDLVTAVHVADVLASELDGRPAEAPFDETYVSELGLLPKLDGWRARAQASQGAH